MREINIFIKRTFDFFGSVIGLLILLPFIIFVGILIKIDSRGPMFFKQKRLGRNGEIFEIIKFRTMVLNAEYIGDGLKVKNNNDNRITNIGRILRKTSLDEIPQLINIVKGEMSFVGPRPPVTYHPYKGIENYPHWAKKRFEFKPGITGLSQVKHRNTVSWEKRIELDITYIERFNILFDIKLILLTILKIFQSDDIYANK